MTLVNRDAQAAFAPHPPLRLTYGSDRFQFGDLYLPAGAGPHPVVIGIHGGFWHSQYGLDYYGPLCAALAKAGVAAWNIEYRRIGNRGGGWPNTLLDAARAADYLREIAPAHALDLSRIVTMGHSAGGQLAFWLGARHKLEPGSPLFMEQPLPLRGLVSLAGVLDLRRAHALRLGGGATRELLGGSPDLAPARFAAASPYDLLPLGVPQVIVHGTEDINVPYEMATRYMDAARKAGDPVSLLSLEAAGHFECVDAGTREWAAVQAALMELL